MKHISRVPFMQLASALVIGLLIAAPDGRPSAFAAAGQSETVTVIGRRFLQQDEDNHIKAQILPTLERIRAETVARNILQKGWTRVRSPPPFAPAVPLAPLAPAQPEPIKRRANLPRRPPRNPSPSPPLPPIPTPSTPPPPSPRRPPSPRLVSNTNRPPRPPSPQPPSPPSLPSPRYLPSPPKPAPPRMSTPPRLRPPPPLLQAPVKATTNDFDSSSIQLTRSPPPRPAPREEVIAVRSVDDNFPGTSYLTTVVLAVVKCGERSSANFTTLQVMWTSSLPIVFRRMSFGAMVMPNDPKYNRIVRESVDIGCPQSNDIKVWAALADADARSRLDLNLGPYRSHVYILPPSFGMGLSFGTVMCPLTGTADIPSVWSAITNPTVLLWAMVHELGHNLGLLHSGAYDSTGIVQEYGDTSCPMGGGQTLAHYNAPQSIWLGWTIPQAVLRADDLSVGVWNYFSILPLASSRISSLQIFPGFWMPGSSLWDYNNELVISFRHFTSATLDGGLPEEHRNKVQVHRMARNYEDCGPPVLVARLDDKTQTTWPRRGPGRGVVDQISPLLVVTVERLVVSGNALATVKLCRAKRFSETSKTFEFARESGAECRDGLDNDCDGQVDNC